ncbi:MAG: CinA family protein [Pseudomonadales bacterium]
MKNLEALGGDVAERLVRAGTTVAVAESSTGGLISAALLAVPGASAYYRGGSVIYTLEARRELLGIRRADVEGLAPLTEEMVARFAARARQQLGATWAIAELGVAGPTPARYGHAPGLSVLAVDGPRPMTRTIQTGIADREANMWHFTEAALTLLADALAGSQTER